MTLVLSDKDVVSNGSRVLSLDVIRVLACFMVIMIHVRFAFDYRTDSFTAFYLCLLRPCVPWFIMLSGALLLPLKTSPGQFFKRRGTRVLVPFLLWSLIYVFLPTPAAPEIGGTENMLIDSGISVTLYNLIMIPLNFTWSNVHFWFIYTIIGLYMFIPVISPWIEKVTRMGLVSFLAVWGFTLFLPYLRLYFPQIHGECDWNEFGMTYYFNGYIGYLLAGYFLVRYNKLSTPANSMISLPVFLIGLFVTFKGFNHSVETEGNIEFFIGNLTINVAMMTLGGFMFLQKISLPAVLRGIVTELSKLSYGIFLVHYIICLWIRHFISSADIQLSGSYGQPLLALVVFAASYFIIKAISYVPASKWLVG